MLGAIGCVAIFVIICYHCILGFFFTWIANAIAREDFGIPKGVGILLATAIMHIIALVLLRDHVPDGAWWVTSNAIRFGILTGLTWFVCETTLKQALIIAAIYTVLINIVEVLIVMAFG